MSRGVGPRSDPDDALAVAGAASAPAAAASVVLRVGSPGPRRPGPRFRVSRGCRRSSGLGFRPWALLVTAWVTLSWHGPLAGPRFHFRLLGAVVLV